MNGETKIMSIKKKTGTNWERLKRQREGKEPIDFSDIPELDSSFWKDATIVIPAAKTKLTIRIDTDVYQWFNGQGPGYQTRINAVLRSYMEAATKQAQTGKKATG